MVPSTNRPGLHPFKVAMLGSNPAGITTIIIKCRKQGRMEDNDAGKGNGQEGSFYILQSAA